MPAAYYDIYADEGATFRIKLKYMDSEGKVLDILNPQPPAGFESRFTDQNGNYQVFCYVRMEVRNTHDGDIVRLVGGPETPSYDTSLIGNSAYPISVIQIELGDGGENQTEPNITITIEASKMNKVNYGKYLYDIDVVYTQDIVGHPNEVVYKILQGRFIVNPSITRSNIDL